LTPVLFSIKKVITVNLVIVPRFTDLIQSSAVRVMIDKVRSYLNPTAHYSTVTGYVTPLTYSGKLANQVGSSRVLPVKILTERILPRCIPNTVIKLRTAG